MEYNQKKTILSHQINVIMERIHYAEGRRNNFVIMATALMASGITLITFTISDLSIFYNFGLFVLAICFVITSLIIWLIYSLQTNFYPFTDFTRNNKWFYRNTLKDHDKFNVTILNTIFGNKKTKKKVGKEFENQFEFYKNNSDNYLNDENEDIKADQNQIYILHVNEKYKNLYITHLKKLTEWGIIISFLIAIITTAVFSFII